MSEYRDGFLDGLRIMVAFNWNLRDPNDLRDAVIFHDKMEAGYQIPEEIAPRFEQRRLDWRDEFEARCRSLGAGRPIRPLPAPAVVQAVQVSQASARVTLAAEREKPVPRSAKAAKYQDDFLNRVEQEMKRAKAP